SRRSQRGRPRTRRRRRARRSPGAAGAPPGAAGRRPSLLAEDGVGEELVGFLVFVLVAVTQARPTGRAHLVVGRPLRVALAAALLAQEGDRARLVVVAQAFFHRVELLLDRRRYRHVAEQLLVHLVDVGKP